ncbi:MAG TPA: MmgE/PrpD family protein [Rhodopila sp.]|uniref:MmgE/PrpD family protein n=1 Tax=Rhodopila sp. TaxID=2480087 RepID=UPI002D10620E|nr:MmgE/PrpD family protein [Rhodopila sp.]HVY17090.1 MmgE/PrpD family protein [Rhodopila sp.]
MHDAVTTEIAAYAAAARLNDLPELVKREARRSLFNILGCTLGGARHHGVIAAEAALGTFAGPGPATLIGRGHKADPLHAALINCLASSVYSFDDTHEQAVVHPSGPVASAALAMAETHPVSGAGLLLGFALGVEVTCRLCKALTVPPAKGSMAWSGTGITGGIGAAIAAGRMLGFDTVTMRTAIGIALSQAAGFRAMHGSLVTPLMPAQAAQTGLRAAFLAQAGFTASPTALEGRYGFLSVFSETPDLDALSGALGSRWEILRNTYKPYPCGIVIHPIIDACLALRTTHHLHADDIKAVDIKASPGAMALCNNRNPKDEMQAHVSLHHWTAVAFIRGTARIQDMDTETAVRDPALMAFQDRVNAELDPSVAADAAIVAVTLRDGTQCICRIEHGIGSVSRPMSDAELEVKFAGMAEPLIGAERTRELMRQAWAVEALSDAGALARMAA